MPITYLIDQEGTYVHATASGVLTTDEVCQYEAQVEADEAVKPGFRELMDVRWITGAEIDKEGFGRIAQAVRAGRKRGIGSKLAIVAQQSDSFDRARYYERLAYDIHNVIVFNSLEVAEVWLGVKK
jgi:hypothetical protein